MDETEVRSLCTNAALVNSNQHHEHYMYSLDVDQYRTAGIPIYTSTRQCHDGTHRLIISLAECRRRVLFITV